MNTKTPAFILFGLLALRSLAAAAPAYDFFVCANINRNYVIGSKIVTTNGIFQRDAAGATSFTPPALTVFGAASTAANFGACATTGP